MAKYLDENGLKSVINKIKSDYVKSTDSRLTDARTPKSHSHSKDDITDLPSMSDYVKTDDSRLSNARTPLFHTHTATEVTYGTILSYTVKKNVYINTNGAEIGYNGWDDTDFIDISGYSRIYCNINNQWNCWYTSDKTFLSQANFTNKTYLDVPTNAKYLRVSGTASAINSLSVSTSNDTVATVLGNKADKSQLDDYVTKVEFEGVGSLLATI